MRALLFLIAYLPLVAVGQQKKAQKYVYDLASPEFYGRGYTHGGDSLAANYIRSKFKTFGLQTFDDSFYQYFKLNVNTFPGTINLSIDNKDLEAGKDFIVDPYSGSADGEFDLFLINSQNVFSFESFIQQNAEDIRDNKWAVIIHPGEEADNPDSLLKYQSLKYQLSQIMPVFYVNDKKLTWGAAREHTRFPIIELKSELVLEENRVQLSIKNKFIEAYQSQNVIGYIPGSKKCKAKKHFKVITAHYDHLGEMGDKAYIPGANDNASGCAMLLSLAQYYAENPPKDYSVVFMAFGGEEAGLVGSKYYTENPLFPLSKIDFLLNLDLQGTGEEGITVVNATLHQKEFQTLLEINKGQDYLSKIKKRGPAQNSDHYFFTKKGVPAFFIYTMGGISAYHDIYDKAETLPLTEFNDLFKLYIEFLEKI